jgi:hypothetical protein
VSSCQTETRQQNIKLFSDPEVVLESEDANDATLNDDYESYEGFYGDDDDGSFGSNDPASAAHSESSQGRLTCFLSFEAYADSGKRPCS